MRTRYLEVNEILTNRTYREALICLLSLKSGDIIDLSVINSEDIEDEGFILTLLRRGNTYLALDSTYFGFEGSSYTLEEALGADLEYYRYNIVSYK